MRRIVYVVPVIALALVAGCSADSDEKSSSKADRAPAALEDTSGGAKSGEGPGGAPAGAAKDGSSRVISARVVASREHIIKNAFLTVETRDVDRARNEAVALAQAAGGDVASEQRSGTDDGRSAVLVLRVPPGDFDALVTNLGKLGTVRDTRTETQDVTGEVADIEGRISAAQDSVRQIRKLIDRARAISDIVALEREFQARDAEIQSMTAQLTSLKDRSGRSTVTLTITTPDKSAAAEQDTEFTGFVGGLRAGWKAFVAAVTLLLTVLGALLPFLVLAGIALAIWLPIRRRRPAKPTPEKLPWPSASAP